MKLVCVDGSADGFFNMEADIELLQRGENGELAARVYSWDGPWISLGKFQQAQRALISNKVPLVQRPTGGKAVLHGHDITVGMAVPFRFLGLPIDACRSLGPVYRSTVGFLIESLKRSGVNADLGENTGFVEKSSATADCFAHVAPNDVVDPETGQKICGCALRLGNHSVLVQASIPNGRPLVDPALVFANPALIAWRSIDKATFATHLDAVLNRAVTIFRDIP